MVVAAAKLQRQGVAWSRARRGRVASRAASCLASIACALSLLACPPPQSQVPRAVAFGHPNRGVLLHGAPLPDRGPGYVRARPGESTRFGTRDLLRILQAAAAGVATDFPGGEPLRVGDLSGPGGGAHARHGSHRTGRDVDLVFFALDADGLPTRGKGWLRYDRFGVGHERKPLRGDDVTFFDAMRNWAIVRYFLIDEVAPAQWIFCAKEVKDQLLAYALVHEPEPEVLLRALWVLHEPSYGNPHLDHFHVRIACSRAQLADGCEQGDPAWPWLTAPPEPTGLAEAYLTR